MSSGSYSARADDPRRRATRHETELACDLGDIIDLSMGGMRVRCAGKPAMKLGQTRRIRLQIPEGNLSVTGRAVWVRRRGLRKYEVGIQFIDLKPRIASALDSIGRFGFITAGGAGAPGTAKSTAKSTAPRATATIEVPDYYAVLGVDEHADTDDIRNSFRRLARELHPDVSGDVNSAARFMEVQEAYEVLKDIEKRKWYDLRRAS